MSKLAYLLDTKLVAKLLEQSNETDPNKAIENAIAAHTNHLGRENFIKTFGTYDLDERYNYKEARK